MNATERDLQVGKMYEHKEDGGRFRVKLLSKSLTKERIFVKIKILVILRQWKTEPQPSQGEVLKMWKEVDAPAHHTWELVSLRD